MNIISIYIGIGLHYVQNVKPSNTNENDGRRTLIDGRCLTINKCIKFVLIVNKCFDLISVMAIHYDNRVQISNLFAIYIRMGKFFKKCANIRDVLDYG